MMGDILQASHDFELELIGGQALFAEATLAERRTLAAGVRLRSYRKNEVIYHQDDSPGSLFLLLQGLAKIELMADDDRHVTVGWLGSGSLLGTMSLIDGGPRQESAIAAERCEVVVLQLEAVRSYLREHPAAAWRMLELVTSRWREMTKVLYDAYFLDIQGRIAKTLLKFLVRGVTTEVADQPVLHLSQAELASLVGGTRETVNRCLHSMQRQEMIAIDRRGIRILQADALRRCFAGAR